MLNLVNTQTNLRHTSPLSAPKGPSPTPPPSQPTDKVDLAQQQDSSPGIPKWATLAFTGLGLVAGAAGMAHAQQAQVVVNQDPQQIADVMQRLDEASLKQGIELEWRAPSPIGGGRRIDAEGAADLIGQGRRVLLTEITSSTGPARSKDAEPTQVRRQSYLTGQKELESYARYFTNAEPQNDVERSAQKLKKYVYSQMEVTTLQHPGQNAERPSLSPFAAARRLSWEQPVNVRTEPDGITRTEAKVTPLKGLSDVETIIPQCQSLQDFKMGPDGTIQLVERTFCDEIGGQ